MEIETQIMKKPLQLADFGYTAAESRLPSHRCLPMSQTPDAQSDVKVKCIAAPSWTQAVTNLLRGGDIIFIPIQPLGSNAFYRIIAIGQ